MKFDPPSSEHNHQLRETLITGNFIKGYLSANRLSDFWLSKIPMFINYRRICMNPENNLGCKREEWIYNIENDILFDGCGLKSVSDIITTASGCNW